VPDAKLGVSVPADSSRPLSVASVDTEAAARVAATEYVRVVLPSCAVTTTLIVVVPTASDNAPLAGPLVTVTPPTFTVQSWWSWRSA